MASRVAVIGAGSWGTTVAHLAAHNVATVLWARRPGLAARIAATHTNDAYLPGFALHPELSVTASLPGAVAGADVVVMAVPSLGFRETLVELSRSVDPSVPLVSLAKGLEQGSRLRMTEVIAEVLPGHPAGVLTGPNLAKEILAGHGAAAVVAMADGALAAEVQRCLQTDWFRVYRNHDVVGSELAAVVKNVIAIASGMADGLGTGDNTRAAVITRGLAEMSRLGVALGGDPATFAGLAGVGDLVATSISPQSRNRHVGEQLGRGRPIGAILAEMDQVAEGVASCRPVLELATEQGVEMPIVAQVVAVVQEGRSAADAYRELLRRDTGHEDHGVGEP